MTEQYTPTTEQVRDDYQRCGCDRCSLTDDSDWADEHAEFDRWLAEHEQQVKAEAWDEGRDAEAATWNTELAGTAVNPYREVTE